MTSLLAAPAARTVRWRYHFTDFRLGRLIATLPLSDVALSDVLNGAADGAAVVPLSSATVRDRDPFSATVPRRCCLWAERQEWVAGSLAVAEVPWAGIVMKRERSHATRELKLSMVTWPGYFQRRLVGQRILRQWDKFAIFRRLLGDAVTQPAVAYPPGFYGNSPHTQPLEWTGPGAPSGVLADRSYLASDLKPTLEALTELGNSGDGFDWRLVPYMATPGDLSSFRVRADLGYPRLGRIEPADLRWSTDRADARQRWGYVSDLSITEDGSNVANRLTAVGSGTGTDQIRATVDSSATYRDENASGYPLYEASLGSSTAEDRTLDTVQSKALGGLLAGFAGEVTLSGVKVRGDLPPTLSSYTVGDDATIKVGETTTGLTETFVGQIVGRTIRPAESGRTEEVTFDVQGTVAA